MPHNKERRGTGQGPRRDDDAQSHDTVGGDVEPCHVIHAAHRDPLVALAVIERCVLRGDRDDARMWIAVAKGLVLTMQRKGRVAP